MHVPSKGFLSRYRTTDHVQAWKLEGNEVGLLRACLDLRMWPMGGNMSGACGYVGFKGGGRILGSPIPFAQNRNPTVMQDREAWPDLIPPPPRHYPLQGEREGTSWPMSFAVLMGFSGRHAWVHVIHKHWCASSIGPGVGPWIGQR